MDMKEMRSVRENPPASVYERGTVTIQMYRTLYDDIRSSGLELEYQDRHALGELAVSIVEMNELRKLLLDEGEWVEVQGDRNVIRKKNPARDALEKLRPVVTRLMRDFNMTPSSRKAKLGPVTGNPSSDDPFDGI